MEFVRGRAKKSWISYGGRPEIQEFLRAMRKKLWNSAGWKSENYMEFLRVWPISNGILEGLANLCRISLGFKSFLMDFFRG